MFRYTNTIKQVFGKYEDVKQITDLWKYLETDFVDGLYEEEWYNTGTPEGLYCPDYGVIKGILTLKVTKEINDIILIKVSY